ncbi:MAG TPA: hypothetical protein VIT21_09930, partial [Chthoniobacterales bacterium]
MEYYFLVVGLLIFCFGSLLAIRRIRLFSSSYKVNGRLTVWEQRSEGWHPGITFESSDGAHHHFVSPTGYSNQRYT